MNRRVALPVYLQLRGSRIAVPLPLFYVRIAQALHALQDAFTHTLRTADGLRVTSVLNWVEYVGGTIYEPRDGPSHMLALDGCIDADAALALRRRLATEASVSLLLAALDPSIN